MSLSPIAVYLESLLEEFRHLRDGQVANYIPELSRVNPDAFGICIATHDGHVYEVGDSRQLFTIQSISKPLTYGLALEQNGEAAVLAKIGVEPSGDAFNAISLHPLSGTPRNPLINAGAIAAVGLVKGQSTDEKAAHILDTFSRYAGRALDIDPAVYQSESQTGHRNRAIGWMLHNFNVLADDPTPALEAYFQQCAIRVNCRDLALMGATLANGGVNPVTGVRAVPEALVDNILSVMATCGMYDASGDWIYRIGLPAKSGVGGGIMAVQPGRLCIAIYSPPLDAQGNSVRGVAVCRRLAHDLGLHQFDAAQREMPAVRLATNRRVVASKRRRQPDTAERLRSQGTRLRLYHLHGVLLFSSIEPVIRTLMERSADTQCFILNLRLVPGLNAAAARLLQATQAELARQGKALVFSEAGACWDRLVEAGADRNSFFTDDDFALEYGENRLLTEAEIHDAPHTAPLSANVLCAHLSPDELAELQRHLEPRSYHKGQMIIAQGQKSDELFLLTQGTVMVSIPTQEGIVRLDSFDAGDTFGELAFLDHSPRSANVTAMTEVVCQVLTRAQFEALEHAAPSIKIRLLENLTVRVAGMLRQTSRELALLK